MEGYRDAHLRAEARKIIKRQEKKTLERTNEQTLHPDGEILSFKITLSQQISFSHAPQPGKNFGVEKEKERYKRDLSTYLGYAFLLADGVAPRIRHELGVVGERNSEINLLLLLGEAVNMLRRPLCQERPRGSGNSSYGEDGDSEREPLQLEHRPFAAPRDDLKLGRRPWLRLKHPVALGLKATAQVREQGPRGRVWRGTSHERSIM
jgi:hypothetical protein